MVIVAFIGNLQLCQWFAAQAWTCFDGMLSVFNLLIRHQCSLVPGCELAAVITPRRLKASSQQSQAAVPRLGW